MVRGVKKRSMRHRQIAHCPVNNQSILLGQWPAAFPLFGQGVVLRALNSYLHQRGSKPWTERTDTAPPGATAVKSRRVMEYMKATRDKHLVSFILTSDHIVSSSLSA